MSALDNLRIKSPDAYTLTDDYNAYIESLITHLRNHSLTTAVSISPEQGYLYQFDMTGFLLRNNFDIEDHRLIMRMNNLYSVHQMDENIGTLLVPNQQYVASLKMVYRTRLTN